MIPDEFNQLLTEGYCPGGKLRHRTATLIKLFPYVTTPPSKSAVVEDELSSFWGICGEISRLINGLNKGSKLDLHAIEATLKSKIETRDFPHLLDVVRMLAFDENGALSAFSLSAIPYLSFAKDNSTLREIGAFLYEVFFRQAQEAAYADPFSEKDGGNVLHKLIYQCLPSADPAGAGAEDCRYHKLDVGLSEVFEKDWGFLCDNPSMLHVHFPEFAKLYGFIYQLRVIEKLNNCFDEESLDPIFFTLDWESCSAIRRAYLGGWKRVEPKIETVFSHVNCLELLNHLSPEGLNSPYTYLELKEWTLNADPEQRDEFNQGLDYVISFYKETFSPKSGWGEYETLDTNKWDCEILNKVERLWQLVDYQFEKSSRGRAADGYAKWLFTLAQKNYIKRRGHIGHTLAFSRDQIMFLTRLAVGEKEKFRLREFWLELERRGVAFDHESRRKIVELFERLNLLEKKSDSGDAQYVRAII